MKAWIALGSNMGNREENIARALKEMKKEGLKLLKISGKTCHQGLEGGSAYRPGYWGAALCKVCSCMATMPISMWTRAFAKPALIRVCSLVSPVRRTRRLQSNSENLPFY